LFANVVNFSYVLVAQMDLELAFSGREYHFYSPFFQMDLG